MAAYDGPDLRWLIAQPLHQPRVQSETGHPKLLRELLNHIPRGWRYIDSGNDAGGYVVVVGCYSGE
jgi:hypothetical protein